jgi:rhomboid protease GluP
MCPNCRAFVSISDRVCPYCEAQLGPRAIDLRATRWAASLLPQANLASMVVLIVNAALFIAEVVVNYQLTGGLAATTGISGGVLVLFGAKYSPYIAEGQWWRFLTAGFLHAGFLHIAMNSWVLFDLVGEVEQFYGTSRLIVAYVFTTIVGFMVSRAGLSVGASAACFGLIGLMLAIGVRGRTDPLLGAVRSYYGRWALYGLAFTFFGGGIDIGAHLGGLAAGFLLGLVCGYPGHPGTAKEQAWKGLAGAAIALTLYAFIQDALSFPDLLHRL